MTDTPDSPESASPGRIAFARMAERYPPLSDPARIVEVSAVLQRYVASLNDLRVDRREAIDSLLALAQITGDAGAPAVLLREYVAALDRAQAPLTATRASHVQALDDLAEIMRRETGDAAAKAEARARLDPISGLPDRNALQRKLAELIGEAQGTGLTVAVLCIDLHHITPLLDQPGHATQEDLVRAIAGKLRSVLRPKDLLARSGIVEFTALLPGLSSVGFAALAAGKVHRALSGPLQVGDLEVTLYPAVGISSNPDDGDAPFGLLQRARNAADEARTKSVDFDFYQGGQTKHQEDLRIAQLEHDVNQAIDDREIEVHFQPQLDLRSGKVLSVEALLRWHRCTDEVNDIWQWVNPVDFIEVVDRMIGAGKLSALILHRALAQVDMWDRAGIHVSVGVNLWAKALLEGDLPELIQLKLKQFGLEPDRLLIEITEGKMIEEWERSEELVRKLKAIGVHVSMDDFGTGYSHFSWLRALDVDEIKIDQLFVRELLRSPKDEPIVRSMINLGHELGLQVIAEGVEDQATQDALTRMGCDRIQGYHFCRPKPGDDSELLELLKQRSVR